ncbi:hypothetical protein E1B28_007957 [Marasmius oreades]|uniref:Uncharacterized protein n=1 Tax=Marasmius oreades TaxID=181124 RepID=A0A9P7S3D0_9AGAR|nr:uncharacterized protein E1B28_007957 [Marasmius oreades]KAG7094357.1 hypothetical protein E1B28_007957 [Marasmius oreades]
MQGAHRKSAEVILAYRNLDAGDRPNITEDTNNLIDQDPSINFSAILLPSLLGPGIVKRLGSGCPHPRDSLRFDFPSKDPPPPSPTRKCTT